MMQLIPRAAVSSCIRCLLVSTTPSSTVSLLLNDNNHNNNDLLLIPPYYLLIKRGKEPSAGKWSFPGGKLEYGETTIYGAQRELSEEVQVLYNTRHYHNMNDDDVSSSIDNNVIPKKDIMNEDNIVDKDDGNNNSIIKDWNSILQWYPNPIMTSDFFGDGYHYLIAQCYGEMKINIPTTTTIPTVDIKYDNNNRSKILSSILPSLISCDDATDAQWFTMDDIQLMKNQNLITPGIIDVIYRMEELDQAGLLLNNNKNNNDMKQ